MPLFSETVRKLWNEWEIRVLVLLSLCLQIILVLLGKRRKYTARAWARVVVWLAYLSADRVAIFTLGILSDEQGDCASKSDGAHVAFWAPFLLVHLGGPDSITAYSLEDNELWLRHFLELLVEAFVAFYVFTRSWTSPASPLTLLAIPMFVSGIIKYGERTWVLYSASYDHFGNDLQSGDEGKNLVIRRQGLRTEDPNIRTLVEILKEPRMRPLFPQRDDEARRAAGAPPPGDEDDARQAGGAPPPPDDEDGASRAAAVAKRYHDAYLSLKTVKRLFADLIFSKDEIIESRRLFLKKYSGKEAFKVIEVELGFFYDVLFTKAPVFCSATGILLRFISFASTSSVFVGFLIIGKQGYSRVDVGISYALVVGALVLEIYAIVVIISSDWTIAWLSSKERGVDFIPKFQLNNNNNNNRWSDSMAQFSIIDYCERRKPSELLDYFSYCRILQQRRHMHYKKVPADMKEKIFQHVLGMTRRKDAGVIIEPEFISGLLEEMSADGKKLVLQRVVEMVFQRVVGMAKRGVPAGASGSSPRGGIVGPQFISRLPEDIRELLWGLPFYKKPAEMKEQLFQHLVKTVLIEMVHQQEARMTRPQHPAAAGSSSGGRTIGPNGYGPEHIRSIVFAMVFDDSRAYMKELIFQHVVEMVSQNVVEMAKRGDPTEACSSPRDVIFGPHVKEGLLEMVIQHVVGMAKEGDPAEEACSSRRAIIGREFVSRLPEDIRRGVLEMDFDETPAAHMKELIFQHVVEMVWQQVVKLVEQGDPVEAGLEYVGKSVLDMGFDESRARMKDLIFQHVVEMVFQHVVGIAKQGNLAEAGSSSGDVIGLQFIPPNNRGSVLEMAFDERLILWHIATDLCYHYDHDEADPDDVADPDCKMSKLISDYMFYLVVVRTSMLPKGYGNLWLEPTFKHVTIFLPKLGFKRGRPMDGLAESATVPTMPLPEDPSLEEIVTVPTVPTVPTMPSPDDPNFPHREGLSMLTLGFLLAKELRIKLGLGKWEALCKVWMETLCFAASRCGWKQHAQQLAKGGELLTHVSLLMAHLGLTDQTTNTTQRQEEWQKNLRLRYDWPGPAKQAVKPISAT